MASASAPEGAATAGERRGRLLELLLGGSVAGPDRDPLVFVPVLLGLVGPSRGGEGGGDASPPVADRIVLVNPLTQGMVVLRAGGGGPDLAGLMREMLLGTEEGARGPPPASRESIEAMRAVERPTGEGDEGEECAVCLEELWAAEVVKEMPCRHRFHGGCIEKWLGMHGSCPVCRYRMPEEKQPERRKVEGERRRRRGLEGEIWVALGFGGRVAERQQQQQQEQHATEEEEEEEADPDES